jgi:hypothetical protein
MTKIGHGVEKAERGDGNFDVALLDCFGRASLRFQD